uniref:Uncharacterized protein n=1 Tax=Candidatus Kentrum sp. TC TaxID=2126339 RepID=A0A450YYI3_9GAMM|nr:MAG: hypothetical protein BECKTC1821E_GA0114239_10678 [Candidatus Kentron sp. TC]
MKQDAGYPKLEMGLDAADRVSIRVLSRGETTASHLISHLANGVRTGGYSSETILEFLQSIISAQTIVSMALGNRISKDRTSPATQDTGADRDRRKGT